jgi:hypothetical protein
MIQARAGADDGLLRNRSDLSERTANIVLLVLLTAIMTAGFLTP